MRLLLLLYLIHALNIFTIQNILNFCSLATSFQSPLSKGATHRQPLAVTLGLNELARTAAEDQEEGARKLLLFSRTSDPLVLTLVLLFHTQLPDFYPAIPTVRAQNSIDL